MTKSKKETPLKLTGSLDKLALGAMAKPKKKKKATKKKAK